MESNGILLENQVFRIGKDSWGIIFQFLGFREKSRVLQTCKILRRYFYEFGTSKKTLQILFQESEYFEISVYNINNYTFPEISKVFHEAILRIPDNPIPKKLIRNLLKLCLDDEYLLWAFSKEPEVQKPRLGLLDWCSRDILLFLSVYNDRMDLFSELIGFGYYDDFTPVINQMILDKYKSDGNIVFIQIMFDTSHPGLFLYPFVVEVIRIFRKIKMCEEIMSILKNINDRTDICDEIFSDLAEFITGIPRKPSDQYH